MVKIGESMVICRVLGSNNRVVNMGCEVTIVDIVSISSKRRRINYGKLRCGFCIEEMGLDN